VRPPSWLRLGKPRREGDHAVVDVEVRERVFILAASRATRGVASAKMKPFDMVAWRRDERGRR